MKISHAVISVFLLLNTGFLSDKHQALFAQSGSVDKVGALIDTLKSIIGRTNDFWLKLNCESILRVINSKQLTSLDKRYLGEMYDSFVNYSDPYNPSYAKTYLERQRPMILSWVSPTDGSVSLSWLRVPRNWTPGVKYPVYVELHGLWSVASDAFDYMTYPFKSGASYNNAFEDGFHLSPWGRGNMWYQGNSEKDIWECMAELEEIAETDSSRKYLCGHSMGGYGAISIAGASADTWAAVGIYAGALGYYPSPLNASVIDELKDVPIYFVCGTQDNLYDINEQAYLMLGNAGNTNLHFTSFNGGHEYRAGDVFEMYMWMRNFVNDNVVTAENVKPFEDFQYTNPVHSVMNIRFAGVPDKGAPFYIFDLSGRLIRYEPDLASFGHHGLYYINTSELTPGTYIFKLCRIEGQVTGIFVKQ